MREAIAFLLVVVASLQLAAASVAKDKVVRMKRNLEESYDLQFHDPEETGLVRIKRHRRSAEEPSLVRVKRDEEELQRYKRQKRDVEEELHRFKRQKRDAEDELKRYKRQKRDVEDELQRYKRIDPEPELIRQKRSKREVEASPALAGQKKAVKEKKRTTSDHRKTPKVLKREKKTNINHHWAKHEKRSGNNKHHIAQRLKKNVLGSHRRSNLLANHALRNVHLLTKRNKLGKHRVKRTQEKLHQVHPYNRLEADVAKLGRLRRDIALNLHKANMKDIAKRRVKRTHPKTHKKIFQKKH